jgi:ABC-2 type transport system ATP-binding protein
MKNPPAIEVRGLRVARGGRPVLHGLDLTVADSSVTGLLGPSGCGKTTLLRCVVGVQRIESGDVRVLGHPAGSPLLGAARTDPARVLEQVGLGEHEHDLVGRLSGGQRARVSLAAALLGTPELLVLDEPTVGLDPVLRQDLWQLFHRLAAQGTPLLISSHVMDEAARCTELLLMREGRLLAQDTPQGLLTATGAHDIESAFLALVAGSDTEPARGTGDTR